VNGEQPTRLESLGVLLSYALVVMFSGEMPEMDLTQAGEITPLREEFPEFFASIQHGLWPSLTRVAALHYGGSPDKACRVAHALVDMQMIPSAIRQRTAQIAAERSEKNAQDSRERWPQPPWTSCSAEHFLGFSWRLLCSFYLGIAAEVERRLGVPRAFVGDCWTRPAEMDAAWHAVRERLAAMRSEEGQQ
jgi:hypothetical protein